MKRINPSDNLKSGDIHFDANQMMVKNWFQCRHYSFSEVLGIRARLQVDFGLEENYEVEVLLKGGNKLLLDVNNECHMSFVRAISKLNEEKVTSILGNIFHRHLTEWTFLYKSAACC